MHRCSVSASWSGSSKALVYLLPVLRTIIFLALKSDRALGAGTSNNNTRGRPLPENLSEFYDNIRAKGSCSRLLATRFWATDTGNNSAYCLHSSFYPTLCNFSSLPRPVWFACLFGFCPRPSNLPYVEWESKTAYSYCGDHIDDYNILYIQGRKGALADMDIDCDGAQGGPSDDGRCSYGLSPDLQNTTAFQDIIVQYDVGISDLNTYVHPYVVLGNDAPREQKRLWTGKMGTVRAEGSKNWKTFNPQSYGIEPLSVVAVVCGGGGPSDSSKEGEEEPGSKRKLVYGIWGDTNGDDGIHPMVGETSLSLATACEGDSMNGDNGYDGTDVLYVAFLGKDAVPGPEGADWTASDFQGFEKSISGLGDRLVQRVGTAGVGTIAGLRDGGKLFGWVVICLSASWVMM